MKKYLIAVVLLLSTTFLFSSQSTIDSLRQALKIAREGERITALNELADIYLKQNDFKSTIPIFQELLSFQNEKGSPVIAERVHYLLGKSFFYLGNYKEALQHQENAFKKSTENDNVEIIALSLMEIGYIYQSTGEYVEAIIHYQKSLPLFEELEDKSNQALILNRIGSIFKKIEENDKALEYYQASLQIREEIGDQRGIASSYNNIALIYQDRGQYNKALDLYFSALDINESLNNQRWKSYNLNNIGFIYYLQNNYEEALEYFSRSLEIKEQLQDTRGILHTLGNVSSVLHELGRTDEAISYYLESLRLAKEISSSEHERQCYYDLSELYRDFGDFKKAYEYTTLYIALNDSLFNREKIATITEIQTKYETEKKEQEIALLTKSNEIQELRLHSQKQFRNLLLIIILLIIILASILIYRYKKHKRLNDILQEQKALLEKSKAEIEAINKHLEQRIEEEVTTRRAQEHKALEQSRLAALGELAAGIAHEINQPLHSIAFALDNLSMAIDEHDADEVYLKKKISLLFDDVQRMKRIIDHIRTFSRKQSDVEKALFNINEGITSALQMIREQFANHGIHIELHLQEDLPKIMGNFYKFEQVVLVMLSNGKDAVEQIKENNERDYHGILSIKTVQHDNSIEVIFSDNGIGISDEDQKKIFNPFFTTKEPGRGTGLGLSIAFGIVNEMRGSIEVESTLNKGTRIIISIPIETERA